MRVGCLVQRLMATTLITNDQLGLKERRDASSAGPFRASLRQARRPWSPQHCAVYNRLVLPDVEIPQGPLASATSAAAPVAGRARHCLALPVCDPHMQDALRSSALLKSDIEELLSPLSPLGSLREPCQHTCLKHLYRTLGPKPSAGKILPSGRPTLEGMQECCPPSVASFFSNGCMGA